MVDDRPTVLDLQAMLDLLAQTVVNALGFAVAAVNLVESPRRVVVVSVAGPDEVRDRLLGTSDTLANWERMLAAGQTWGRLAFLDHSQVSAGQGLAAKPVLLAWACVLTVEADSVL